MNTKKTIEHTVVDGKASIADKVKKEFLCDIAAMATSGGTLIIGVETIRNGNVDSGIPTGKLFGLPYTNADGFERMIESLIQSGIRPKIFNLDVKAFARDDGYILVIEMPKSILAPHMVSFGGENRYYHRTTTGKESMDPESLRTSILFSGGLVEQARRWRDARMTELKSWSDPTPQTDYALCPYGLNIQS